MKPILSYGQAVLTRKRNNTQAAQVACFQTAVDAIKSGCRLRDYERVTFSTGLVAIRKRRV